MLICELAPTTASEKDKAFARFVRKNFISLWLLVFLLVFLAMAYDAAQRKPDFNSVFTGFGIVGLVGMIVMTGITIWSRASEQAGDYTASYIRVFDDRIEVSQDLGANALIKSKAPCLEQAVLYFSEMVEVVKGYQNTGQDMGDGRADCIVIALRDDCKMSRIDTFRPGVHIGTRFQIETDGYNRDMFWLIFEVIKSAMQLETCH